MHIESLPLGLLETNCHIVWSDSRDCFIVDPSGEAERILEVIDREKLTVRAILLTHAHFDHIGALPEVWAEIKAPVYLHAADEELYRSPKNCMLPWAGPIQNLPDTTSELPVKVPDLEFELLETPGHTPGGVSFYFARTGVVLAGDCLFRGSVGRTDLPGGDTETLFRSIKDKLFALPVHTRVLSGHGPETEVGYEKKHNPFVGERAGLS